MQKILILFVLFINIFASYNPFFKEVNTPSPKQKIIKKTTKYTTYKPRPSRKNIEMTYFGFIDSQKGKFALVSFQNKNIIIQASDSLYIDEQIFNIKKITSNYILLKDRYNRLQTVYFSSQLDTSNTL